MFECEFCKKVCKNTTSIKQHTDYCKENPNKQTVKPKTEAWYAAMRKRKGHQDHHYTKARLLGLPRPTISEEYRERLRIRGLNQIWTEERRKRHSESMKKAVLNNPDSYSKNNVSGRAKLVEYGNTKLKGGWEVKVAVWLDKNNISWTNEIEPIKYSWEGKDKLYFPDFYLPEYDLYIEVKGYKRDIDEAKWNSVEKQLLIVDKSTIHKIDTLDIDFLKKYHTWKVNCTGVQC